MNDAKYEDIKGFRHEGKSWAEIAAQYDTNARALGKAFSVARLARGGAPLRKDAKRASKPAVPEFNGDPNAKIKEMLLAGIEEARQAEKDARRDVERMVKAHNALLGS